MDFLKFIQQIFEHLQVPNTGDTGKTRGSLLSQSLHSSRRTVLKKRLYFLETYEAEK